MVDGIAESLLPAELKERLINDREKFQEQPDLELCPHILIRSRFAEDLIQQQIKEGTKNIVILGAGTDTRSLRLGKIFQNVAFIEIDALDTQNKKSV